MTGRFASVERKIERAKEHISQFEDAIRSLNQDAPYAVAIKDHTQPGQRVAYVSHVQPWLPERLERLSLIVGDAAHTLRSALDHFACAAVPVCTDETAFPIWRKPRTPTPQDFKALMGRKVQSAPQSLLDALLAVEPYAGGKGQQIWILDYLDAVDKHRLLVTIALAHRSVGWDMLTELRRAGMVPADTPPMIVSWNVADRAVLAEGIELFIAPPYYFDAPENLKFAFDVAFGEPEIIEGQAIAPTLRQLVDDVERLLQALIPLA